MIAGLHTCDSIHSTCANGSVFMETVGIAHIGPQEPTPGVQRVAPQKADSWDYSVDATDRSCSSRGMGSTGPLTRK